MPEIVHPLRVLFLCTGNSARSQIAEALLREKGGGRFEVASAGVDPAPAVHPEAVRTLAASGIDWSGHGPKGIEAVSGQPWDIIITTCDRARESCPTFPGQPVYAHWSIPDPAAADPTRLPQAFDETLFALTRRIDLMLAVGLDRRSREALQAGLDLTQTGPHPVPAATGRLLP